VGYDNSVIPKENPVILSEAKDLNRINSIRDSSPSAQNDTEKIYQRYLAAFKKGVYNYIKDDQDPVTQQAVPRKYFSGGVNYTKLSNFAMTVTHEFDPAQLGLEKSAVQVTADLSMTTRQGRSVDQAMRGMTREEFLKALAVGGAATAFPALAQNPPALSSEELDALVKKFTDEDAPYSERWNAFLKVAKADYKRALENLHAFKIGYNKGNIDGLVKELEVFREHGPDCIVRLEKLLYRDDTKEQAAIILVGIGTPDALEILKKDIIENKFDFFYYRSSVFLTAIKDEQFYLDIINKRTYAVDFGPDILLDKLMDLWKDDPQKSLKFLQERFFSLPDIVGYQEEKSFLIQKIAYYKNAQAVNFLTNLLSAGRYIGDSAIALGNYGGIDMTKSADYPLEASLAIQAKSALLAAFIKFEKDDEQKARFWPGPMRQPMIWSITFLWLRMREARTRVI